MSSLKLLIIIIGIFLSGCTVIHYPTPDGYPDRVPAKGPYPRISAYQPTYPTHPPYPGHPVTNQLRDKP